MSAPRFGCANYFLDKGVTEPKELSKAEFDALATEKGFSDGPYEDSFGDGYGEPYYPNRQAFGTLADGTAVYCELVSPETKMRKFKITDATDLSPQQKQAYVEACASIALQEERNPDSPYRIGIVVKDFHGDVAAEYSNGQIVLFQEEQEPSQGNGYRRARKTFTVCKPHTLEQLEKLKTSGDPLLFWGCVVAVPENYLKEIVKKEETDVK